MPDAHEQDQKADTKQVPAFAVPAADPLLPSTRMMLTELREQRRNNGRLWLKAFAPKERQEFLLERLDRAAELEALDERGEVDDYMSRVMATFDRSLNDVREPADTYVFPRAA